MSAQKETDKTCIIVVQVKTLDASVTMGVIVDNVSEVLNVMENQIEATPSFGSDFDTSYLMGIGKVGTKVVMLLNIDKVLIDSDLENIYSNINNHQSAGTKDHNDDNNNSNFNNNKEIRKQNLIEKQNLKEVQSV